MVDATDGERLAFEALHQLFDLHQAGVEDLDRNGLANGDVLGLEDRTHTAL